MKLFALYSFLKLVIKIFVISYFIVIFFVIIFDILKVKNKYAKKEIKN